MEDQANENDNNKKSIVERINDHFSKTEEEELSDEIPIADIGASIFLIIVNGSIGLYFIAHQTSLTGFFTTKFSTFEMVMLYGIMVYWITTSVLILIGQKHPSQDLDSYGGLFFATFAIAWLFLVFPFEFTYFADVLQPEFLRPLVRLISNDIGRILMILAFIIHLGFGVYALLQRLYIRNVRKERAQKI